MIVFHLSRMVVTRERQKERYNSPTHPCDERREALLPIAALIRSRALLSCSSPPADIIASPSHAEQRDHPLDEVPEGGGVVVIIAGVASHPGERRGLQPIDRSTIRFQETSAALPKNLEQSEGDDRRLSSSERERR